MNNDCASSLISFEDIKILSGEQNPPFTSKQEFCTAMKNIQRSIKIHDINGNMYILSIDDIPKMNWWIKNTTSFVSATSNDVISKLRVFAKSQNPSSFFKSQEKQDDYDTIVNELRQKIGAADIADKLKLSTIEKLGIMSKLQSINLDDVMYKIKQHDAAKTKFVNITRQILHADVPSLNEILKPTTNSHRLFSDALKIVLYFSSPDFNTFSIFTPQYVKDFYASSKVLGDSLTKQVEQKHVVKPIEKISDKFIFSITGNFGTVISFSRKEIDKFIDFIILTLSHPYLFTDVFVTQQNPRDFFSALFNLF